MQPVEEVEEQCDSNQTVEQEQTELAQMLLRLQMFYDEAIDDVRDVLEAVENLL